ELKGEETEDEFRANVNLRVDLRIDDELIVGPDRCHAPVDGQALIHVRDVLVVNPEVHSKVDVGTDLVLGLLALQLLYRLLEQLHVHVEADGFDMAALLAAEQVAGSANLEVQRSDAEAAAEIAELANRRETLLRNG